MHIKVDELSGPEIRALLEEHLQNMHQLSPRESVHALDIHALQNPEITFWTAWSECESDSGVLLGCCALKELSQRHGEIKSMRTCTAHRRKGVAKALLVHIIEEAQRRCYDQLSLETGSAAAFEPARKLYASFGFTVCSPFADYRDDPNSYFMTKPLMDANER